MSAGRGNLDLKDYVADVDGQPLSSSCDESYVGWYGPFNADGFYNTESGGIEVSLSITQCLMHGAVLKSLFLWVYLLTQSSIFSPP